MSSIIQNLIRKDTSQFTSDILSVSLTVGQSGVWYALKVDHIHSVAPQTGNTTPFLFRIPKLYVCMWYMSLPPSL